jgi:hypothetical protein
VRARHRFKGSQAGTRSQSAVAAPLCRRTPYGGSIKVHLDRSELDESEKILWARSLAATPEQRWQFNLAALRFYNFFPRSIKHGFK